MATLFDRPHNHANDRYAIGVLDKETGRLRLAPLLGSRVMRMEARLHRLDYGPSEAAGVEATTREERLEQSTRLVNAFGSTRRRRQLNSREEGIVRAEKLGSPDALTQARGWRAVDRVAF